MYRVMACIATTLAKGDNAFPVNADLPLCVRDIRCHGVYGDIGV